MERIIDMSLSGCNCGVAITGSFCTFDKVKIEIEEMSLKEYREGLFDVLVTAPINKHTIQSENFHFPRQCLFARCLFAWH